MNLENKVAIVTGASSDKGGAISEVLASEGALVTINYLKRKDRAESFLKKIEDNGGKAMIWQADVTLKEEVDEMVRVTTEKFGSIDILATQYTVQ